MWPRNLAYFFLTKFFGILLIPTKMKKKKKKAIYPCHLPYKRNNSSHKFWLLVKNHMTYI